jgi:DNA-binding SARP family transcriptional activator
MIRCQTLGPVSALVDGQPAPPELMWRKHLALLIVLARAPRRTRSREQLTGLLWAEKAESAARHSLNEALRVIRRAAGDDALDTHGDQITLAADAVEVDLDVFEALLGKGDLAAAVGLIGGEFLEGFAIQGASEFENWLSSERRHWSARSVTALCSWAEAESASGRVGEAMAAAERALLLDPLAESALGALLRNMVLQGERTAALERYDRYAAQVRDRLGTEPSAAVRALADRIRQDRARTSRPAALAASEPERRRVPLIGREQELSSLLGTWSEAVASRQPRSALVLAEPGMGRTRLAEEVAARVRLNGGAVVHARAVSSDRVELESGLLALAAGDLLNASGIAATPPGAIAVLSARVPAWAERFGSRESRVASRESTSVGSALLDALRTVAEETPVLVWIDDAHFLDATSFGFLERIPRDFAGLPVMVLICASAHPAREELDTIRARMGREVTGVTLVLDPLDDAAVVGLAGWALPGYSKDELERLSRRLARDTAGLPLLLVELLGAVAQGLELEGDGGAWPQPFHTLDQTLPGELPDSITAAIRVSFRRLSAAAQKVLATASVLSDRVLPGDLAMAAELPQAAVLDALDELEWARWLVAEPRGYTFMARVVRDVIARDMLTPGQRRRISEGLP